MDHTHTHTRSHSSSYTSKSFIKKLYEIMYHTHEILVNNGILYYIDGGTLLGAVRHGGIIPWDDDIDIEVGYQDMDKVVSLRSEFKKKGYNILDKRNTLGWVKIVGKGVDVDVFPVRIEKINGVYRTAWDFEVGEKEWPKCYLTLSELFPLKEYKFGDFYVLGPNRYKGLLDRCYGKSWKTKGYITMDKNHMLLDTPILVKKGSFEPGQNFYKPKYPTTQTSELFKRGIGVNFLHP